MTIKAAIILAVLVCTVGMTGAFAKEKGTMVQFPHWGIITVPDDVYIEAGTQPMLTAGTYGNDVVAMMEKIYPVEPQTYQLVQKENADFQYGYMLRYTISRWELEAAAERDTTANSYLRDIGAKPDMKAILAKANRQLATQLPADFRLVKAMTPKKINGTWFYEGTVERTLVINQKVFKETIYPIAYVHGNTIEIAVIFANVADQDNLITTVASILESAKKLPKK